MVDDIRNIYCVGRNYGSFAKEMGNKLTEQPIIFMKPTHSLKKVNAAKIKLDGTRGIVNGEAEIVLHIGRSFEKGIAFQDLVDKFTIGIDFTYREVLNSVKEKGQPWLPAKGFPGSSGVGEFKIFTNELLAQDFKLIQNGHILQVGNAQQMIFSLDNIIDFIGGNYGLRKGDLIYTGTPEGIATLQNGDTLEVQWGENSLGTCQITLKV
ncbi:fumarylacetoacetate hydrolase family protein [Bacillus sp. Marseille-P3661]|uniref:fumarylacetoacetate hydrolase family protein n=1 Tax=Bacillus sp. Marseille-P3661 TaxID=1936234 RepID=UPI000C8605BC|nr:fumarylacetoacetate hydrolase family protein [Bacillus sp. Marseille-P3661]